MIALSFLGELEMDEGFIFLSRSLLDSEVFASQKMLKIWIWCLCKANFKSKTVPIKTGRGETSVKIKRGQFIFGRFKAEDELCIDGSTIYKIMKKLEQIGNISIKSNSHYSVISICNYETYQDINNYKVTTNKQPSNNQVTGNKQPSNTTNNDNNVNKDNKYTYNAFYDNQIELSNQDENYIQFVKALFGENNLKIPLKNVLKLNSQLTYEQFKLIYTRKKEKGISLVSLLEDLDNRPDLTKKYTHLQKVLLNWMK